jgi:hypothetical protein
MATRRRSCPPVRLRSCRDTEGRWGRWGRWGSWGSWVRWGSCVALGLGGHPGAGPAAQPLRNNPHGRPRHRIAERQVPAAAQPLPNKRSAGHATGSRSARCQRRHNPLHDHRRRDHDPPEPLPRPATPPEREPKTPTPAQPLRNNPRGRPPHRNAERQAPPAAQPLRNHRPPRSPPAGATPPAGHPAGSRSPRCHTQVAPACTTPLRSPRHDPPTVIGDRPSQSGLDSTLMGRRSRFVTHVPEIGRPGALNNDDNGLSTRLTVGSAGSGRRCRGRCTRSRTWAAGSGSGSSAPGWSLGAGCGACRGTGARLRM